jgi:hypothetical protein
MSHHSRRCSPTEKWRLDWILTSTLLLAFALRLINLTLLPIFYDEANYLRWAKQTVDKGDLSIALNEVSTLQVWLIALFYKLSPSALWIGRFVSVGVGLLLVALCYRLAWQLYGNKDIARLAALLYAVIPYALFHDRVAQNDGLLSLFVALVIWLSVRGIERPSLKYTLPLILAFGLAFLTKRSGILFFVVPGVALGILYGWLGLKQRWRWLLGVFVGFVGVTVPIVAISVGSGDQLAAQTIFSTNSRWLDIWAENAKLLGDWFYHYFLFGSLIFLGVAMIKLIIRPRRQDVFLAVVALMPILFFAALSVRWYPRYLLPAIFPLMILLAGQIFSVAQWLSQQVRSRTGRYLGPARSISLLAAMIVLPMGSFAFTLLRDPTNIALPEIDRWQYVSGWPAGYGLPEVAHYLADIVTPNQNQKILVWRNSRSIPPRHGLPHYLAESDQLEYKTFDTAAHPWLEIQESLDQAAMISPTYLVLNHPYEKGVPDLKEIPRLRAVATFPKPDNQSQIGLYRWVTPFEYVLSAGNLAPQATVGIPPRLSTIPLDQATQNLMLVRLDPTIKTWSDWQNFIAAHQLNYLVLDAETIRSQAAIFEPFFTTEISSTGGSGGDHLSLKKLPSNWSLDYNYQSCQVCLFHVWGNAPGQAALGEDIQLLSAQVTSAPWWHYKPLLVTLHWRTTLTTIDPDIAVFLHGVNTQGQLVTQQDKTWLAGGFPTLVHQPADILSQQFELNLSMVQGDLCLYTGLYRRSSGERFSAVQQGAPLPNNAILLQCGQVE